MRLVVQRVLESSVKVDGREVGRIGKGFMVLCGVEDGDTAEDVRYCVDKTVNLRIFEDENDKMNLNLEQVGGSLLVVSQFTLYADTSSRRPGFTGNMMPGRNAFDTPTETVVNDSLRALSRGRARVFPGMKIRLAALLLNAAPLGLIRFFMGRRPRKVHPSPPEALPPAP